MGRRSEVGGQTAGVQGCSEMLLAECRQRGLECAGFAREKQAEIHTTQRGAVYGCKQWVADPVWRQRQGPQTGLNCAHLLRGTLRRQKLIGLQSGWPPDL